MTIYCEPFTQAKYRTTHQIHAVEKKCPVCGEKFTVYSEHHAYKIGTTKKKKVCSWNCMRQYDLAEALKRKAECETKIAFYQQRVDTTTGKQKNTARMNLNSWIEKLRDINLFLEMNGGLRHDL